MKVAAIQFAPEFKKPKDNILRAAGLITEAARNGARLIVLPELMTTGYSFLSEAEARPFAENLSILGNRETEPSYLASQGQSMGAMFDLCAKLGVRLVWGLVEEDPGTGKLYNSQVYMEVQKQGPGQSDLKGLYYTSYRKICLWGNDFIWAQPGESNPPIVRTVIDGVEWKIGLLICRDIKDKKDDKWTSFYEPGESDIVCFSANWGDGGFPATGWMEFVSDNKTNLIVANRYGKETCNNFGEGGICVITKPGKVHCEGIRWEEDCIVYAELTK